VIRFLVRVFYDRRVLFILSFLVVFVLFSVVYFKFFFFGGIFVEAFVGGCGLGGSDYLKFVFDFLSLFFRFSVVLFLVAGSMVFSVVFYDSLDKRYFIYEFFGGYSVQGLLLRLIGVGVLLLLLVSLLFSSLWLSVFSVLLGGYGIAAWLVRVVLGFVALVIGVSLLAVGLGGSVAGAIVVGVFASLFLFFAPAGQGYSGVLDLYALGLEELGPAGLGVVRYVGVYPVGVLAVIPVVGAVLAGLRVVLYEW